MTNNYSGPLLISTLYCCSGLIVLTCYTSTYIDMTHTRLQILCPCCGKLVSSQTRTNHLMLLKTEAPHIKAAALTYRQRIDGARPSEGQNMSGGICGNSTVDATEINMECQQKVVEDVTELTTHETRSNSLCYPNSEPG